VTYTTACKLHVNEALLLFYFLLKFFCLRLPFYHLFFASFQSYKHIHWCWHLLISFRNISSSTECALIFRNEHDDIKKTKLHGLSPRANQTGRATAACRRSDCQLLRIEGCHLEGVTNPYCHILGFLDRSRYFSIK
jgi:hypothetical protein